mmetsp:Transcript_8402/g.26734  ORF Transcript_8402/g.26734 Transcript_8402/m.26734 type:complete len:442 (+) Transcript_8402:128-1453(+)
MQMQTGARTVDASDAERPAVLDWYKKLEKEREEANRTAMEAAKAVKEALTTTPQNWLAPAGIVKPNDGEVYFGDLKCNLMNMGVRVTVRQWPKDLRVYVFPKNEIDYAANRWCPPVHTCSGGFDATVKVEEDVMNITPTVHGKSNVSKCNWPEFNMVGSFWRGRPGEVGARGALEDWKNKKYGTPFLEMHHSDNFNERFSTHCRQLHKAVLGSYGGGGLQCTKFELEKCAGRPAKDGEKIVYFMRSFAGDGPGESDPPLKPKDHKQALSIKNHPLFRKAFGDEDDRRAEVIYMPPTTRALQSAVLAFGTENVPIKIDLRLKDRTNKIDKAHFETAIRNLTDSGFISPDMAKDVIFQYRDMHKDMQGHNWESELGSNDERIQEFYQMLLERPEKRVVVIGHKNVMEHALGFIDLPGGVESRILHTTGAVSTWGHNPYCWGSL